MPVYWRISNSFTTLNKNFSINYPIITILQIRHSPCRNILAEFLMEIFIIINVMFIEEQ